MRNYLTSDLETAPQSPNLGQVPSGLHENDRRSLAKNLGLTLERFDELVASANYAHYVLKELGPFYGKEEIQEPTFRITAEPVTLPKGAKKTFEKLGMDILYLGKALSKLPENYKNQLGADLDFKLPPSWRIDAILGEDGSIKINELEGADGATALMSAEQLAYNLQSFEESTAAKLAVAIKKICKDPKNGNFLRIALIRWNNQHTTNTRKFIKFIHQLSSGGVRIDLYDEREVREGQSLPDLNVYDGVWNESSYSPKELAKLGVKENMRLSAGDYNAICNKGVFSLLHDRRLAKFWVKQIGKPRLERLQSLLVKTTQISTQQELETAKRQGKVVKASWAGNNIRYVTHSKGVAMPQGQIEQSSTQRWDLLKELLESSVKLVAQDYIKPAKVKAYLRKKGTNLEAIEWYNRVCVKYVCTDDPNLETPKVDISAVEVTLGPEVVPACRECAFTAGKFVD